jgi:hypothetical protein
MQERGGDYIMIENNLSAEMRAIGLGNKITAHKESDIQTEVYEPDMEALVTLLSNNADALSAFTNLHRPEIQTVGNSETILIDNSQDSEI